MTSHSKVIAPSPKYSTSISSSLNSRFGNYPQSTSPNNNLFPNASRTTTTTSLALKSVHPSTPPPLDELLNDCFLFSIDELRDPDRICHVKKFVEFTTKHHCQENLKFLVEIYKYEFNYDHIFPISSKIHRLNNTPSPSLTSFLNNASIDSCIGKSSTSLSRNKKSYAKSILSTTTSLKSEDLDANTMFVSTIDDLEPQNLSTINSNIWEGLKEKTLQPLSDSDDDDEGDAFEDDIEEEDISDADREALALQWENIIVNYIQNDAPDQINLSQKLCDQIHHESAINRTHKPWILLTAKNEVFQIVKENVYMNYSSRERANCSKCCDYNSSNDSSNSSNNLLPGCRELSSPKSTSLASSNVSSTIAPGSPATIPRSIEISKGTHSGSVSPMGYLNKQSYKHVKNKLLTISTSVSSLSNNNQHTSPMNPTPASLSVSPSQSLSSVSNLFGHLKLYNNSSSSQNPATINNGNAHQTHSSHQHNNIHHFGNVSHGNTSTANSGTATPVGSTLHSLTNSPEGLTPTSTTVSSLKFWNKKKTNHS